jgi:hypothetical protein
MTPPDRVEVVLYADHNQFWLAGGGGESPVEDDEELWSETALETHLGVQRGTLAVYTATYGYVRVIVELVDAPRDGLEDFDHVVEAPLDVGTDGVTVLETTNPQGTLEVPPGTYRARVCWRGVAEAEAADPERDAPVETVLIQLWPGAGEERRVLKWYRDWAPPDERPQNPHGLRVLVGGECDAVAGGRVVGEPKDASEFDNRVVVRDDEGVHWLRFYSERPPYGPVMLELPDSALDEFDMRPEPPRVEIDAEEAARSISLPATERYRYFVETVRRSRRLYALEAGMAAVVWQYEDGRECIPVWPHRRGAELYAEDEVVDGIPVEERLDEWLETLERYYDLVAVFPASVVDDGVIVPSAALREDLGA